MRKVVLAAALAALGSAGLAVPASASFDPHFTVFENARFHVLSNERVFTIRGGLYDPLNHDDRVGSDHRSVPDPAAREGEVSRDHSPQR